MTEKKNQCRGVFARQQTDRIVERQCREKKHCREKKISAVVYLAHWLDGVWCICETKNGGVFARQKTDRIVERRCRRGNCAVCGRTKENSQKKNPLKGEATALCVAEYLFSKIFSKRNVLVRLAPADTAERTCENVCLLAPRILPTLTFLWSSNSEKN